ncbi:hypothetical protein BJ878DRAFT_477537 [Calycina marina]|uniref:Uncharacterized protein n=1 Tax=Calycina marina TaxID=1763456 RepID=A0A9P8CHF3_9HELO|nr:hypothetical protein BJ878DRAFT_477537 [Calycina marina]
MVLFKRKPVQYVNEPIVEREDQEVWHITQTGEIFMEYELYLNRMDFYKQRRFICQITGHSGLNFFEALKSELAGAQEVEEAFPEALKGPILRRVQFQTISRIDTLVDLIYDEYRADYYPGEAVTVHVLTGERLKGIVRDKTRFGSKLLPDGTLGAPFSRYFVSLDNRPTEEAVVDDAHITRDRKIFTKQVLRSFIKKTVTREAWTGAPWLVKDDVAAQYHIDTRVPPHLRYESKAAERKANQQQKKTVPPDYEGMIGSFSGVPNGQGGRLPELKPATKSHKSKQLQGQAKSKQPPFLNPAPNIPHFHTPPISTFHPPRPFVSHTFQANGQTSREPQYEGFPNGFAFPQIAAMPPAPPPAPPIKYPIDDLEVAPRQNGPMRPDLKFFSQQVPLDVATLTTRPAGNGIMMKSVGSLLETWDTLNVYCEIFKLDSFTFDDFAEAMQFTSDEVECELLVEVHCAALKILIDSAADGGRIQIHLPKLPEEEVEEEEVEEVGALPEPTPETEPKPKGRATRSSLAKAEAQAMQAEATAPARDPTPEPKSTHRAVEMQIEMDWIERLQKRDFNEGGWQVIVAGLLYRLSRNPRQTVVCEEILKALAPLDMEPTKETARLQYAKLNINLRIQVLQILCMLTAETKAVRGYMEQCSEEMTTLRKEKIKWQREKKIYTEELRQLNEERKIQLPANMPASPTPETKSLIGTNTKMIDVMEDEVGDSAEEIMDTDDDHKVGRSLRRGQYRDLERKRKREVEQESKDKAEADARLPKLTKQFARLLKDISKKQAQLSECEEEIAVIDNDLREADCPRTRVLGKDRFWNRYYWFERNGMPYAGLPSSSTADAGYANGCLWVQGPDDIERAGYIEIDPHSQYNYRKKYGMTVPERKMMEEGATHVFTAGQWGYIDDPQSLDDLIQWLDPRGSYEVKFKKELILYRDRIVCNMEKRKAYLKPVLGEAEENSTEAGKRMSTRKKDASVNPDKPRCLTWHNNMAINELGHLHSDQPRPRKPVKKIATTIVVEEERPVFKVDAKGKRDRKAAGRRRES